MPVLQYQWNLFRRKYATAFDILKDIGNTPFTDTLVVLLAREVLFDGRYELTERICRYGEQHGSVFTGQWGLFKAELEKRLGNTEKADKLYLKQWQKNKTPETAIDYASFLLYDLFAPQRSVAVIKQGLELTEKPEQKLSLLGLAIEANMFLERFDEIKKYSESYASLVGSNPERLANLYFLLGETEATKGNISLALKNWKRTVKHKKGKSVNDAIQFLSLYGNMYNNDSLFLAYWRLRVLAGNGALIQSADSLVTVAKSAGGSAETELLLTVSEWYCRGRAPQKAVALLKKQKKQDKDDDRLLLTLAKIYVSFNDTSAAVHEYEDLLLKHPDSMFAPVARKRIEYLGGIKAQIKSNR